MNNSILVPVDFSAPSRQAYKYAAEIAKKLKATISLLHVLPPSSTISPYELIGKTVVTRQTQQAEARLKRWSQLLFTKQVPINIITRESISEANEIVHEAEQGKYMLIVMGTKGASNLKEKWMGTVTQKVISSADRPVLAVPARATYRGLKKVIFATDYWKRELPLFEVLDKFLLPFKSHIIVTHISTSGTTDVIETSMKQTYLPEIKKRVKSLRTSVVEISHEDVVTGLSHAADQYSADVIAMVPGEASLLERLITPSITKRMALQTRIPLLAIKQPE